MASAGFLGALSGLGKGMSIIADERSRKRSDIRAEESKIKQARIIQEMQKANEADMLKSQQQAATKETVDSQVSNYKHLSTKTNADLINESYRRKDIKKLTGLSLPEYAKQYDGKKRSYLINEATGPLHSDTLNSLQALNDPDVNRNLPKSHFLGSPAMSSMDDLFKYQAPEAAQEVTEGKQWEVEQQQRRDSYKQSITNNSSLIQQGISDIDPVVLNQIDTSLQFGKQDASYVDSTTGQEINRVDDIAIRGLTNGTLQVVDGTLMTSRKAAQVQELQMEMEAPEVVGEQPQGVPELPKTSQDVAREQKLDQEATARYTSEAKEIGTKLAQENITAVADSIGVARADIQKLDADALGYFYSALNMFDGRVPEALKAMAKMKDPKAKEAYMAMQSLMSVLNVELKDRSGAAVTEPEAVRFFAELGAASATGSLEATMKGLDNLLGQKLSKAEAYFQGREQGSLDQFFATSPKFRELFDEHDTYGSDEGKAKKALRTEMVEVGKTLRQQEASPEEISEYMQEVYGADAETLGMQLPSI